MINIASTAKSSLRTLRIFKIHAALAMLGIVLGVGAVVIMSAIGTGLQHAIKKEISSVGSNLLVVLPGSTMTAWERTDSEIQSALTLSDAEAIVEECPSVSDAVPVLNGVAEVAYGNHSYSTNVTGTTPRIFNVRDLLLASGRSFTPDEVKKGAKLCVMGQTVTDNLFGGINPIGQMIKIKNIPFKVTGVLAKKGEASMSQDQDNIIYVPVTTAQKKLFETTPPGMVRMIMVKAKSTEDLDDAEQQIHELLAHRHYSGHTQQNSFTVRTLAQILRTEKRPTKDILLLFGALASVALLVGGIAIMNIMLVSIAQRTREIGIRMAVGAKRWHIQFQFIIEALIISLVAGVVGIIVGMSGAEVLSTRFGWNSIISPMSILLAINLSAAVGILFGAYPAYRASLINPIDVLRYE